MLPDFRALKEEISKRLARQAQRSAQSAPLLNEAGNFVQHEGSRSLMIRADSSVAEISYDKPISAEIEITVDDMRRDGSTASFRAAASIGRQLEEGMARQMFDTIAETAEEVGNTVDAQGRPLSPEMILDTLQTMDFSFDAKGNWERPRFVCSPQLLAKYGDPYEMVERDPDAKILLEQLVAHKKVEWNAREASRRLAD